MSMKAHELAQALQLSDSTKDKVVHIRVPATDGGEATEYVVESCTDAVITAHKAPATHGH